MNDFFGFNDWFTAKYLIKSSQRFHSFKAALNIILQRGFGNIVETGTTRMVDDWGAGMSTYLFGDFAKHYGKHVWTVDILSSAIEICKKVTEEFKDQITYTVGDSVKFLESFESQIDLLYLDSMDCPIEVQADSPDLLASQNHQLAELKAAWEKLSYHPVILLDDNWFSNGGKAKLSKEFLQQKDYLCLMDYQQSLWIKK